MYKSKWHWLGTFLYWDQSRVNLSKGKHNGCGLHHPHQPLQPTRWFLQVTLNSFCHNTSRREVFFLIKSPPTQTHPPRKMLYFSCLFYILITLLPLIQTWCSQNWTQFALCYYFLSWYCAFLTKRNPDNFFMNCLMSQNFAFLINRDHGAIELCYPGSSCGGHETWVHCAFPI